MKKRGKAAAKKPKRATAYKTRPEQYGIARVAKADSRTSDVVHWRCDLCARVDVAPRLDGRPFDWIDVRAFTRVGSFMSRLCPNCAYAHLHMLARFEGRSAKETPAHLREQPILKVVQ